MSLVAQHLLAFFLIVVAPVWDYLDTLRLKADPVSSRKIRYYWTLCVWLWAATVVAVAAVGMRALFVVPRGPGDAAWLYEHRTVELGLGAMVAAFLALTFLPVVQCLWKKERVQAAYSKALKPLSFFLPLRVEERRWFAFVCVTAGICEELLFRGFLIFYLHVSAFRLSLTVAFLLSSLIFSMQHWYLGIGGVIQSFLGGLIFGLLFLITGNLALSMILHATSDLRLLLLLPRRADAA